MNFKKIVFLGASLFIVLLVAFAIDFYRVSTAAFSNEDARARQLARIDFKQPIDSAEADAIRGFVKRQAGVDACFFNIPDGIMVYSFMVGQQTSDNIYHKVVALKNYKAEKYVVEEKDLAKGCPVMKDGSLTFKLYYYFRQLFA